jgi:hypothetical protein
MSVVTCSQRWTPQQWHFGDGSGKPARSLRIAPSVCCLPDLPEVGLPAFCSKFILLSFTLMCFHDLITTLTWLRVLTPNNGALVTWSSFDDLISMVKWVLFFSLNHWSTSGILGLLGFFRESVSYFYPVHWRMSVWEWNSLKTDHPAALFGHLLQMPEFYWSDLIGKVVLKFQIEWHCFKLRKFSKLGESG